MPVSRLHAITKKPASRNSTSKSTWKGFERRVAADFGTTRVPLSGSNSRHGTNSDTLHSSLYIECKLRGKSAVWELFQDTLQKAKSEHKIPLLAIKKKGAKGYLLVVRPEDIKRIQEEILLE